MSTVVVIHGLWMPGAETALLRRRLRSSGYRTRSFSYRSLSTGIEENAERLSRFVDDLDDEPVYLVGHSLGGVIAVRCLQDHGLGPVERVVCLGSPLKGSSAARQLTRIPGGERLIGKSRQALETPAVQPWELPIDLGIIAGSAWVGLGLLLGGLPRPHDGTVAVEETRLEGATDHLVLPVSHTAMIVSRMVGLQVAAFLETGRFAELPPKRSART